MDEKTVLFDTVDAAVGTVFFENVEYALAGRHLDYIVVHHMEPDHSATLSELVRRYPDVKILCNQKLAVMMKQYFTFDVDAMCRIVKEGDTFSSGDHTLTFVNAPMVHWPEVMMTYDTTNQVLFTADAFGTFGATNGALFADEVDFERDYLEEARRYYTNIVGKYGTQVTAILKKASALEIRYLAPLHGFVWRKNIADYVNLYQYWATYTPEETGVVIAYASVYHHTENAAECLAVRLREKGIPTYMFDVSVAIIENGSWAPTSGKLMREVLEKCRNMTILDETMTIRSAMKEDQLGQLDAIADAIDATIERKSEVTKVEAAAAGGKAQAAYSYTPVLDPNAMFKLSYGLFVLTAKDGDQDNGCIINTASQVTAEPNRITIAVNKHNHTHDMIRKTGVFNVSVLSQDAVFDTFKHFGFQSGRDTDKFADYADAKRSANGLYYLTKGTNALISGKVVEEKEFETHTLFIAEITESVLLNSDPSLTYEYYHQNIKPKPAAMATPTGDGKTRWVCQTCGYVYEGDEMPDDFICPWCKHGKADFIRMD